MKKLIALAIVVVISNFNGILLSVTGRRMPLYCADACGPKEGFSKPAYQVQLQSGDQYYFGSPNYPDNYNNSQTCSWEFIAPEGFEIQLDIEYFEVRNNNVHCNF